MDNLVSPLSEGLMHGLTIAAMVNHQRNQNEALQRQKFNDAREQRIQDMTLANAAEDRSRRHNSEDNAEALAANNAGATPLQNGLASTTLPPPAAQASFSAPLNFGSGPMPLASGALPPGAAGPQQQLPAPPAASMTFGDPLAAMRGSVPPTNVLHAPDPQDGPVQTLGNGKQVQYPSFDANNALQQKRDQMKADQEIAIAKAKRTFIDPATGKEADSLATPVVINRLTVGQKAAADEADRTSREKIAGNALTEKTANDQSERSQGFQRLGNEKTANDIKRMEADPYGTLGINPNPMAKPPANLNGEDFLKTLPAGMAGTVKAIAEGRENPISGLAQTKPAGAQLMQAVTQYDPSFSKERAQTRKAFTSGPDGRNIGALNTATVHLDRWHDAATALQNGSFQPGNEAYNYVASKFGSDKVTNHAFVMNALAGEAASALKGNATDPEIAHVLGTLKPDMSPEQSAGVSKEGLQIFGDKLNTYDERYHQTSGKDDPWSPVLPSAKAVFDKNGIKPLARTAGGAQGAAVPKGAVKITDPNGGVHTFPNQAAADVFRKSAGIQ